MHVRNTEGWVSLCIAPECAPRRWDTSRRWQALPVTFIATLSQIRMVLRLAIVKSVSAGVNSLLQEVLQVHP